MGFYSLLDVTPNMMTIILSTILIGLSVHFSINIISGYTNNRNQGLNIEDSIQEALQHFGPSIIKGGITTGVAFFTLIVSEVQVIQTIGIMLGVSIILTMLASIINLPTLLLIRERVIINLPDLYSVKDMSYPFFAWIVKLIGKHRWIMVIVLLFFGPSGPIVLFV